MRALKATIQLHEVVFHFLYHERQLGLREFKYFQ